MGQMYDIACCLVQESLMKQRGRRVHMFRFPVSVVLGVLLASLGGGCASIVSTSEQLVTFQSTPSAADVYVNGANIGQTPLSTLVARKHGTYATVKLEGYHEQTIPLQSKLNPWLFGNIVSLQFSVFGSTVDFATEAAVEYAPNQYFATLAPIGSVAPVAGSMDQKSVVYRFILVNYDALLLEMAKGSGERLNALFDLLGITEADRRVGLAKLKDLFVKHQDAVEFAGAVETAFHTPTVTTKPVPPARPVSSNPAQTVARPEPSATPVPDSTAGPADELLNDLDAAP